MTKVTPSPRRYRVYLRKDIDSIPELRSLSSDELLAMKAVACVLPFRVNNYVVEELIDWSNVPDDPIYQLTFPQPGMLSESDLAMMMDLVRADAPEAKIKAAAQQIWLRLNPHPAGQKDMNVPRLDGEPLPGMQHKYRETVLFFPSHGQTCHAYCTYCFRWPQFVGMEDFKFANREVKSLVEYLKQHHEVNSVLFTGGDPMIMKASVMRRYIEPLLDPELDHLVSIRIGTKSPAYWPYRYTTDDDADDMLALFEEVQSRGRHLAIMAHYSHPRELDTPAAQDAVRRIRSSGAVVRCQAPLIRHVNDDAKTWSDMWKRQLVLGAIPYYMFVERDTGPKQYFEVPLARALEIYETAYRRVSGLARTVRGPSMSATPGKVVVDGVTEIGGEKVFVLKMIQGRDPKWVGRVFFAKYDEHASWLDQLKPALGAKEFFFDPALKRIKETGFAPAWADRSKVRKKVAASGFVEWE
jgi:KamA family protein